MDFHDILKPLFLQRVVDAPTKSETMALRGAVVSLNSKRLESFVNVTCQYESLEQITNAISESPRDIFQRVLKDSGRIKKEQSSVIHAAFRKPPKLRIIK